MPIVATEILFRLSGGAANADPLASLGGAKSSSSAGANILDDILAAESGAGYTDYRCIYVHNGNASLTLQNAVIWLASNTTSTATDIAIGLGTSAISGTEQTVANEATAPTGVTFSSPATYATGLLIGSLAAAAHKAVWVRRTVNALAPASSDTFTLRVQGDTVP